MICLQAVIGGGIPCYGRRNLWLQDVDLEMSAMWRQRSPTGQGLTPRAGHEDERRLRVSLFELVRLRVPSLEVSLSLNLSPNRTIPLSPSSHDRGVAESVATYQLAPK